jgi:formiminotetrahydrofolate cyclodeaminase
LLYGCADELLNCFIIPLPILPLHHHLISSSPTLLQVCSTLELRDKKNFAEGVAISAGLPANSASFSDCADDSAATATAIAKPTATTVPKPSNNNIRLRGQRQLQSQAIDVALNMAANVKVSMATAGAGDDSITLQYFAESIKNTVTDTVTAALDKGDFQTALVNIYVKQDVDSVANNTNNTTRNSTTTTPIATTYSFAVSNVVSTSDVSVIIAPTAIPTAKPSASPQNSASPTITPTAYSTAEELGVKSGSFSASSWGIRTEVMIAIAIIIAIVLLVLLCLLTYRYGYGANGYLKEVWRWFRNSSKVCVDHGETEAAEIEAEEAAFDMEYPGWCSSYPVS